jgi:hypothetical protein
MINSIRRLYYAIVSAVALIFTSGVFQGFFHQVILRLGGRDVSANQPGPSAAELAAQLTQSLTLLIIAGVVVAPIGALHYWLLRREERTDPQAVQGMAREIVLDVLTIYFGSQVVVALASTLEYLFADPATRSGFANALASVIAYGLVMVALVLERRRTTTLIPPAQVFSQIVFGLAQLSFIIATLITASIAVQSIVGASIKNLPVCSVNGPPVVHCAYVTYSVGSALSTALVALAGFVGFLWLTRRFIGSVIWQVFEVLFVVSATVTALVGLVMGGTFALDLSSHTPQVAFPDSLVVTSDLTSYPFLGPLVVGLLALASLVFALPRLAVQRASDSRQRMQFALLAMTIPSFVALAAGLGGVIDVALQRLAGRSDVFLPHIAWSLTLAGLVWLPLWLVLLGLSNVHAAGPIAPRRITVLVLLGMTVLGATISLAMGLYQIVTGIVGASADPTGNSARQAFAFTAILSVAAAYFLTVELRDQRLTPHPVQPQPPTTQYASIEAVLKAAVANELSITDAAAILRRDLGVHDAPEPKMATLALSGANKRSSAR